MTEFAASEQDRKLANVVQLGSVESVDGSKGTATVRIGDITIPSVPVAQMRAGALSFWWMPTVGEQVIVAAPGGDLARAVVVASIFAGNAPSSDAATPKIDLNGGTLEINGNLAVTGQITATDDVIAETISLKTHVNLLPGLNGSETGEPKP